MADPNAQLLNAIKLHNYDGVVMAINNGADVNGYEEMNDIRGDNRRSYYLNLAVMAGNTKITQYLISNGAVANTPNNYNEWTPLHIAAYDGNIDIVKILLDTCQGSELIESRTVAGNRAIDLAFNQGHGDVVEYIGSWNDIPVKGVNN